MTERSGLAAFLEDHRPEIEAWRQAGGSWDSLPIRKTIAKLEHFGVKLGLERMERLLAALSPSLEPLPTVLVAGTNGKGSSGLMLQALLSSQGIPTGRFASPHLSFLRERFTLRTGPVSDAELLDTFGAVAALGQEPGLEELTFFEVCTGTARLLFSGSCQAAVFEAGLGGRLDATRVCGDRVALVTNISLDHTKTLGPTTADIAVEKAAIVPKGGVLLINEGDPYLQQGMGEIAEARGAQVLLRGQHFDGGGSPEDLWFTGDFGDGPLRYQGLKLGLKGEHQVENAVGALAAFHAFLRPEGSKVDRPPMSLDERAMGSALAACQMEGRLELVDQEPRVLLDGAHNLAGARALARALPSLAPKPRFGVIAASAGKDVESLARILGACFERVHTTTACHSRSMGVPELTDAWPGAIPFGDPFEAYVEAWEEARRRGGSVVICGSLYLLGALRPFALAWASARKLASGAPED